MSNKYKNYLRDLCFLTKEYAREAISEKRSALGTPEESFQSGYVMGFHRFVTLMQQQAEIFGIELSEIQLHDLGEEEFFE